jgi:hypothetical protein
LALFYVQRDLDNVDIQEDLIIWVITQEVYWKVIRYFGLSKSWATFVGRSIYLCLLQNDRILIIIYRNKEKVDMELPILRFIENFFY